MPKSETFRLTVPSDDPEVIAWCKNQRRNMSLSIRLLIQQEIRKNGVGNMFATDQRIDLVEPTEQKQAKPVKKPVKRATEPQVKTQQAQDDALDDFMPQGDTSQPTTPTRGTQPPKGTSDSDFNDMMMN